MLKNRSFKIAIAVSIALHVFVLGMLFIHLPSHETTTAKNDVIHAVAISSSKSSSIPSPKTLPREEIENLEQKTLATNPIKETLPISKNLVQPEPAEEPKIEKPLPKNEPVKVQEVQEEAIAAKKLIEEKKAEEKKAAEKKQVEEKKQEEKKKIAEAKKQEALKKKAEESRRREQAAKDLENELSKEKTTISAKKSAETEDNQAAESEDSAEDAVSEGEEKADLSAESSGDAGEIEKYKAAIVSAISKKWLIPDTTDKTISCKLLVHVGPGGEVLSVDVLEESGEPALDRSAQTAIMKASPLPVPQNSELFDKFRSLRLTFRPQGIMSG